MVFKIQRAQVLKCISKLDRILEGPTKYPVAKFLTDVDGWVIEVEHLEQNGAARLKELLSAGEQVGDALTYERDDQTNKASGNQFYIQGLRNSTYLLRKRVRDTAALGVF